MELIEATLHVYFALNLMLCVATLWVGIVVKGDRVSAPQLAMMMALLILFGIPMAVKMIAEGRK